MQIKGLLRRFRSEPPSIIACPGSLRPSPLPVATDAVRVFCATWAAPICPRRLGPWSRSTPPPVTTSGNPRASSRPIVRNNRRPLGAAEIVVDFVGSPKSKRGYGYGPTYGPDVILRFRHEVRAFHLSHRTQIPARKWYLYRIRPTQLSQRRGRPSAGKKAEGSFRLAPGSSDHDLRNPVSRCVLSFVRFGW
jgi:hypothetical protein